jgi:hypothetical protein
VHEPSIKRLARRHHESGDDLAARTRTATILHLPGGIEIWPST